MIRRIYQLTQAILICLSICFVTLYDQYGLYDSTQTSKFLLFSCFLLIITTVAAIEFCYGLRLRKQLHFEYWLLLVFALFIYITIDRYIQKQHAGFSIKYIELAEIIIFILIVRKLGTKVFYLLFLFISLSGILQCMLGSLQFWGFLNSNNPLFKITGSFFNPGPYAGYLSATLPVFVSAFIFRDFKLSVPKPFQYLIGSPFLSLIVSLIVFAFICITQSRAAVFSSLISTVVLLHIRHKFSMPELKFFKSKLITMMIIAGLGLTLFGLYSIKKKSGDGRLLVWAVTYNMIKDAPLTGVGYDAFKGCYMDYQGNYFKQTKKESEVADNVVYAFNDPLQFIAENGIIGFFLIMAVLTPLFLNKKGKLNLPQIISIAGLISIIVFSLFSYPSQILPIKICAAIYIAFLSKNVEGRVMGSISIKYRWVRFTLGIIIIGATCTLFWFAYKQLRSCYTAYNNWFLANSLSSSGSFQQSITYYEKANTYFRNEGALLAQYGSCLSISGKRNIAFNVLKEAQLYGDNSIVQISLGNMYKQSHDLDAAETCYWKAAYMAPKTFYPLYLLVKLYCEKKDFVKAKDLAAKVLVKNESIRSPAIDDMKMEMSELLKGNL